MGGQICTVGLNFSINITTVLQLYVQLYSTVLYSTVPVQYRTVQLYWYIVQYSTVQYNVLVVQYSTGRTPTLYGGGETVLHRPGQSDLLSFERR